MTEEVNLHPASRAVALGLWHVVADDTLDTEVKQLVTALLSKNVQAFARAMPFIAAVLA